MGNRSRLVYVSDTVAGAGQQISINEVLPFNATLIQTTFWFNPAPVIPSVCEIIRWAVSPQWPTYQVFLKRFDPQLIDTMIVCTECFEFRKNDRVLGLYVNPSNINCVLELIFKESD